MNCCLGPSIAPSSALSRSPYSTSRSPYPTTFAFPRISSMHVCSSLESAEQPLVPQHSPMIVFSTLGPTLLESSITTLKSHFERLRQPGLSGASLSSSKWEVRSSMSFLLQITSPLQDSMLTLPRLQLDCSCGPQPHSRYQETNHQLTCRQSNSLNTITAASILIEPCSGLST